MSQLKRCDAKQVFICEKIVGEEALTDRVNELMALGWELGDEKGEGDFVVETFLVSEESYNETTYRIMGAAYVCQCHGVGL